MKTHTNEFFKPGHKHLWVLKRWQDECRTSPGIPDLTVLSQNWKISVLLLEFGTQSMDLNHVRFLRNGMQFAGLGANHTSVSLAVRLEET